MTPETAAKAAVAPLALTCLSAEQTRELGRRVGTAVHRHLVIALIGDLGAGKTAFVQGLAAGLKVSDPYVTSPTFSLINVYEGRVPLWHADLYRLSGQVDVEDIGLEEIIGAAEGVVAVEWADKMDWPADQGRLEIRLTVVDDTTRRVLLTAFGPAAVDVLEETATALPGSMSEQSDRGPGAEGSRGQG